MAVTFPAWWTPEVRKLLPNIEDVMIARFTGMFGGVKPVYWMPTDGETQKVVFTDSEAFLRIFRIWGQIDLENMRNIHRVQFAAISEDRNVSSDIVALVLPVLYAYQRTGYVVMPDSAKVSVKFRGETLGPVLDPQLIRDERLVHATVEIETPWPKGVLRIIQDNLGL